MKFVFLTLAIAISGGRASAENLAVRDWSGQSAPVVYNKSTVTNPVAGLIVLDALDGGYYGYDSTGNWSQMTVPGSGAFVESKNSGAVYPYTANQWADADSLSLSAGEWEVSAQMVFDSNGGASGATNLAIGISTTSGNSTTGLQMGDNEVSKEKTTAANSFDTLNIAALRVTPTTTTTYYFKVFVGTATANTHFAYRISARKIR